MPCIRPTSSVAPSENHVHGRGRCGHAGRFRRHGCGHGNAPCRRHGRAGENATRSRHSRHNTWPPRPTSMMPTAVSIGRDRLSGMAWPSSRAAPAKTNRVRVCPSPQVRPCLTISPTWLRRAAMLDTAAIWSASRRMLHAEQKAEPQNSEHAPPALFRYIKYQIEAVVRSNTSSRHTRGRPGSQSPLAEAGNFTPV